LKFSNFWIFEKLLEFAHRSQNEKNKLKYFYCPDFSIYFELKQHVTYNQSKYFFNVPVMRMFHRLGTGQHIFHEAVIGGGNWWREGIKLQRQLFWQHIPFPLSTKTWKHHQTRQNIEYTYVAWKGSYFKNSDETTLNTESFCISIELSFF